MSSTEYNEDELVPPAWINNGFFQEVLSSCEKVAISTVKINDFIIEPATKKGDHYASVMFRALVKYQLAKDAEVQSISMIIKTMPEVDTQKFEFLEETDIFETEIAMYTEVIPRFHRILRNVGDKTVLGAGCLYHSLTPRKLIIFEDLAQQGFAALRESTTLDQAKCAYMKLAKWHAISYKINAETPEYFNKFRDGIMNMQKMTENHLFQFGITHFVELLEKTSSLSKYKPYFQRIHDDLITDCKQIFNEYHNDRQAASYYVLCHGDFHAKNMMLQKDSKTGQWLDIMLVDFQLCFIGSIAIDILYSLYMLIDDNLRPTHIDELLQYYFQIFTETLQSIGFDGEMPTLTKFREQLFRHRKWEMFLVSTFLPVWDGFRDGSIDIDQLFVSKEYVSEIYQDEKYRKRLEVLLQRYEYLGFFDE